MAEAADTASPAQSKLATATSSSSSDVSARLQQVLALLFPSNLAAKAALFAVVVALLPLLPTTQAPRLWELPHLLLLGIIISYGVFGQKNADACEVAAAAKPGGGDEPSVEAYVSEMMQGSFGFVPNVRDDDHDDGEGGGATVDGVQAWSSQYLPDDPLVVVADNVSNNGDAGEKPLHLPVRKLKPAAAEEPATKAEDIVSDRIEKEEEEEFSDFREFLHAPKTGYGDVVRERAIPSPSSVLDADLTLSPSSPPLLPPPPPPPPPPFLVGGARRLQKAKARSFNEFGVGDRSTSGRLGLLQNAGSNKQFRSKSAVQATRRNFAGGYDSAAPVGYEPVDDDGELDEMVAGDDASDSSFSSDMLTDNDREENSYGDEEDEDDDGNSCDEELFELATRPGPEADDVEAVEDEVDRKAEEFIAKFRDQIRMQRVVEPARRSR